MQMRHALAHFIVDGQESSFRLHYALYRGGNSLCVAKEAGNQITGQFAQCIHVLSRDQETMSGKERTLIEKSQRDIVRENDVGLQFATDNLTKQAGFAGQL